MSYRSISDRFPDAIMGSSLGDVGDSFTHYMPETPGGNSYGQDTKLAPGFNWANGGTLITTPSNMRISPQIYCIAVDSGVRVDSIIRLENGNYACGSLEDNKVALISPEGELIEIINGQQNQEA